MLLYTTLLLADCAKVADPQPRVVRYPAATQKLQLTRIGNRIRLVFPVPPEDIRAVEIYRQCGKQVPWRDRVRPLVRVVRDRLRPADEPGNSAFEQSPAVSDCRYAVRFINDQGRRSDFSNTVESGSVSAALPPTGLLANVFKDRVTVRWYRPKQAVAGAEEPVIVGYLVNGTHLVSAGQFDDSDFQFGQAKTYRVQAVGRAADPLVLSEPSEPLTVTPVDTFPPTAPRNLIALYANGRIQLLWDAHEERDVKGYLVYKGLTPDQVERMGDLLAVNAFTDEALKPGMTYFYRVSAVDRSDNESARSEPVAISTVP